MRPACFRPFIDLYSSGKTNVMMKMSPCPFSKANSRNGMRFLRTQPLPIKCLRILIRYDRFNLNMTVLVFFGQLMGYQEDFGPDANLTSCPFSMSRIA